MVSNGQEKEIVFLELSECSYHRAGGGQQKHGVTQPLPQVWRHGIGGRNTHAALWWLIITHQYSSISRSVVSDCDSRLLCQWDSPGKNTGVGCHSLVQSIPTQGSKLDLLNCRQVLYHLNHQGKPHTHQYRQVVQWKNSRWIKHNPFCMMVPDWNMWLSWSNSDPSYSYLHMSLQMGAFAHTTSFYLEHYLLSL